MKTGLFRKKKEKDISISSETELHINEIAAEGSGAPVKKDCKTRAERRQEKRDRKKRWKEKKKTRRAELKSYYSDAPLLLRFFRLYFGRTVLGILIACLCVGIPVGIYNLIPLIKFSIAQDKPVSKEEIYELSPIDEEGAADIDALPAGSADDTWAIYIYMVGADLEDLDQNSLSDLVNASSKKQMDEQTQRSLDKSNKLLENYLTVLENNDLEPPMFLYEPKECVEPEEEEEPYTYDDFPGSASQDINEMYVEDQSDKLEIVIQTGGARKWQNEMINPNRCQRFCFKDGLMEEEENLPLQQTSDPDTLSDFLTFCKENHPAKHTILILWDHGAGAFGYGVDKIYGGLLSIADVRNAISKVYTPDPDSPPFDIIGYDACLMSNLDVLHSLEGLAQYYVVSEESEPGEGWNYTPWLTELSEHPESNPAQVARSIVDSYTDFYMEKNVKNKQRNRSEDVTMSLIDAKKVNGLYTAYCELAKKQLIESASDISVLAEMGRAGSSSTCYAGPAYNRYNTIDLGNYVNNLENDYPAECKKIKDLLEETVVYHRENGSMSDSTGVSIYHPSFVNTYIGTLWMLDYVFNICEDESIKALYFYKTAGCLTDDMKAYVHSLTAEEPETLNTDLFDKFEKAEPIVDGSSFTIPVDPEIQDMIPSYCIEQASISDDLESAVYYGADELAETDEDGNITSGRYDGKWICLGDQPLCPEIVSSSASSVEYRAKVLQDGTPVYLMFSYDRAAKEFIINGTKPYTSEDEEYDFINMRVNSESIVDSKIVPIYEAVDGDSEYEYEKKGKAVKCTKKTKITRKALDPGNYAVIVRIKDQRGDEYYSSALFCDISGGKIKKLYTTEDFYEKIKDTIKEK